MSLERLLQVIIIELSAAGIPSLLTGSVAAAFHGASRATLDIDVVIDPTANTLDDFVERWVHAAQHKTSVDVVRHHGVAGRYALFRPGTLAKVIVAIPHQLRVKPLAAARSDSSRVVNSCAASSGAIAHERRRAPLPIA